MKTIFILLTFVVGMAQSYAQQEPCNVGYIYLPAFYTQAAHFKGGEKQFYKFVKQSISADTALHSKDEVVQALLAIGEDGQILNIEFLSDTFDQRRINETLKLINLTQNMWIPGKLVDKNVETRITVQVAFGHSVPARSIEVEEIECAFNAEPDDIEAFIKKQLNTSFIQSQTTDSYFRTGFSFVVTKEGELCNIETFDDSPWAQEVLRILKLTNKKWSPASINNTPINSYYYQNILLELTRPEKETNQEASGEVFEEVSSTTQPQFMEGNQQLKKYFEDHMEYPQYARDMGVEGTVMIRFIVNEKGRIKDPFILSKHHGYGIEDEALRLIYSTNGMWKPAMKGDKPIGFRMQIPIQFVLK